MSTDNLFDPLGDFSWSSPNDFHPQDQRFLSLPDGPSRDLSQDDPGASSSTTKPADSARNSTVVNDETTADDLPMSGVGISQGNTEAAEQPPPVSSRRSKHAKLNWDVHQDELKALWLKGPNTIGDIRHIMKEKHSFEASQVSQRSFSRRKANFHSSEKAYKQRFDLWGWKKNLPVKHAKFMVRRAISRARGEGKDTVFKYGGQTWTRRRAQKTLSRKKVTTSDLPDIEIETPQSIAVETPRNGALSPNGSPSSPDGESMDEDISDGESNLQGIPLSWNGHTRSDLDAMRKRAISLEQQGRAQEAESLLLEVQEGLGHVLGPTHEDTNKVAYALANLYAERSRMSDADVLLEDMTRRHIGTWTLKHRRTQQHILHCVELLHTWNRGEDALAFMVRSKELLQTDADAKRKPTAICKKGPRIRAQAEATRQPKDAAEDLLPDIHSLLEDGDGSAIDQGIIMAKSHVAARDKGVEAFLREIIKHCNQNAESLPTQGLRAQSELLQLYVKLNNIDSNKAAIHEARATVLNTLATYVWEKEKFKSIEVMEATMQLTADIFKVGFSNEAKSLFRQISQKATSLYGCNDERTVWISISIGLVHQTYAGWAQAQEWFEQAFAGALQASWGFEDGIVRSLQRAMDVKHFTYLSEEGRPFKSVFGVSGIVIRPGRLHLE